MTDRPTNRSTDLESKCELDDCQEKDIKDRIGHLLNNHHEHLVSLIENNKVCGDRCSVADCIVPIYKKDNIECKTATEKVYHLKAHYQLCHSSTSVRCFRCNKTYKSTQHLAAHCCLMYNDPRIDEFKRLSQQRHFKCLYCDHEVNDHACRAHRSIQSHVYKEHGKTVMVCHTCHAVVPSEHLQGHKINCPGINCPACGMHFKLRERVYGHIQKVHRKRPYSCNICGKTFTGFKQLVEHQKNEPSVPKFKCDQCGKLSSTKLLHTKHLGTHSNTKKAFICDICGMSFVVIQTLQQHVHTVHNKKRDFQCAICETKFSQKASLRRHLLVHLQEKPFLCEFCGLQFRQNVLLELHFKKKHPGRHAVPTKPRRRPKY